MRMKDRRKVLRRGDIVWAELGEHPGSHVQSGRRPCLIINNDKGKADVYTVMPGTCKLEKKGFPVHVLVKPSEIKGILKQATVFMAEQLVTIDGKNIIMKAGYIEMDSEVMKKVNSILVRQLGLNS